MLNVELRSRDAADTLSFVPRRELDSVDARGTGGGAGLQ